MIQMTDGRGLVSGEYQNANHPLTREIWAQECFPGWGAYLNKQIEGSPVRPGSSRQMKARSS